MKTLQQTLQQTLIVLAAVFVVPWAASGLIAQCPDPAPPPGGFALQMDLNRICSCSDGCSTYVDIRYPQATPGACGWPVIIVVHGFGGNRSSAAPAAERLARLGYLTVTYDYRGQGGWYNLNPANTGMRNWGEPARLDLVDLVAEIKTNYGTGSPPRADLDRLGITGGSQGGITSWFAAAWSGKPLPENNRKRTHFPVFKAAVPWIGPAFPDKFYAPQDKAFIAWTKTIGGPIPTHDPTWVQQAKALLVKEDFAGVNALFDQDPFRQDLVQLKTSQVPVYAMMSWNDILWSVDPALECLNALPTSTPRRVILDAANGHGEPANVRQNALREIERERWFARFLKADRNGVDREAPFISAVLPESAGRHTNPGALFWNRYHDAWPPPATSSNRYYLRQNQTLSVQPPVAAESPESITHTVSSGFTMSTFLSTPGGAWAVVRNNIPLVSVSYDTPPLTHDVETAGTARVHLEVTPTTKNFQVHCALYQVSPSSSERFVGSGYGLVRAPSVKPVALDVNFISLNARLLKGDRIRLRVENLTYRPTDSSQDLWLVPYFENTRFDVEHSGLRPSWIDLPIRNTVQPALMSATLTTTVPNPGNVSYVLEAPNHAGSVYLLLLGYSGIATSIPLAGSDPLRLATDPLTYFSIGAANSALLPGSLGTLDGQGSATPSLMLQALGPLAPQIRGLRLNAAAVVFSGATLLASNPLDLVLR